MIDRHEDAQHFTEPSAVTYQKVFTHFSPEEEAWVATASYLDTMASLQPDEQPNLKSFLHMMGAMKTSHIAEVVEAVLHDDPSIARNALQKELAKLRKGGTSHGEAHEALDAMRNVCSIPCYDVKKVEEGIARMDSIPQLRIEPAIAQQLARAINEQGRMDAKIFGAIMQQLPAPQQKVLREILETSRIREHTAGLRALCCLQKVYLMYLPVSALLILKG